MADSFVSLQLVAQGMVVSFVCLQLAAQSMADSFLTLQLVAQDNPDSRFAYVSVSEARRMAYAIHIRIESLEIRWSLLSEIRPLYSTRFVILSITTNIPLLGKNV